MSSYRTRPKVWQEGREGPRSWQRILLGKESTPDTVMGEEVGEIGIGGNKFVRMKVFRVQEIGGVCSFSRPLAS